MSLHKYFLYAIVVLLLGSCTKKMPDSPAGVLEQYIQVAMNAKSLQDKDKLMELTMGSAHDDLEKMTPEQFEQGFISSQLHITGFKTKDLRQENSGDVSLVYELDFQEKGGAGGVADMNNKKIAYLSKDDAGHWKIKETKNVKSFVEKKDALEVLDGGVAPSAKDLPKQK